MTDCRIIGDSNDKHGTEQELRIFIDETQTNISFFLSLHRALWDLCIVHHQIMHFY